MVNKRVPRCDHTTEATNETTPLPVYLLSFTKNLPLPLQLYTDRMTSDCNTVVKNLFEEKTQMNLFDQNTGLPCFLEPDEVSWIDSTRKRLTAFSWTGSLCLPLFNSLRMEILPTCIGPQGHISDAACKQTEQNWKVCLNVNPYSLEDISIKTKEGYLEIAGNREERQENNRLISRSFTRKYKLPFDLDLKQISTVLSPDGILSVEAPLTGSEVALPDETVIPIHMMDKPGFH